MPINHPEKSVISIENLSFNYQHNPVLENVSCEIKAGDYIGLVGPNGGGKTTLLRLITGLLKPQHGVIRIFGLPPEQARKNGKIGYVPQRIVQSNIQCPATVEEIVDSGCIGADQRTIDAAMKDAEVEQFRDRSIDSLSGGERQRVFIARALASEPHILILDEPTTGVDFKATGHFYTLLKHLNLEHKLTIIIVSHDIDVVAKEVNNVFCLNRRLASSCRHEDLQALYGRDKSFIHHQHHHDHA